jgi:hypothetical protein
MVSLGLKELLKKGSRVLLLLTLRRFLTRCLKVKQILEAGLKGACCACFLFGLFEETVYGLSATLCAFGYLGTTLNRVHVSLLYSYQVNLLNWLLLNR